MKTDKYIGIKYREGIPRNVSDALTVEEALQININGTAYTLTMRTPGDDADLVRGLLYTENIYTETGKPIVSIETKDSESGVTVGFNVLIDPRKMKKDIEDNRTILSGSSCGVCGKRMIEDIRVDGDPIVSEVRLDITSIDRMFKYMEEHQDTFNRSGGSHASAAFTLDGYLLTIKEDIGRHNAVDKVIGSLIESNKLEDAKCILVSGRVSYEIVTKVYRAGIPIMAAVSAPSSLAVDTAEELGITLLGFCRGNNATVYSHFENIKDPEEICQKT